MPQKYEAEKKLITSNRTKAWTISFSQLLPCS